MTKTTNPPAQPPAYMNIVVTGTGERVHYIAYRECDLVGGDGMAIVENAVPPFFWAMTYDALLVRGHSPALASAHDMVTVDGRDYPAMTVWKLHREGQRQAIGYQA